MTTLSRRTLLGVPLAAAAAAAAAGAQAARIPIASGPFEPTAESLKSYQAPASVSKATI